MRAHRALEAYMSANVTGRTGSCGRESACKASAPVDRRTGKPTGRTRENVSIDERSPPVHPQILAELALPYR